MERIVEVVSIILKNVMVINTKHAILVHGRLQRHVLHLRVEQRHVMHHRDVVIPAKQVVVIVIMVQHACIRIYKRM